MATQDPGQPTRAPKPLVKPSIRYLIVKRDDDTVSDAYTYPEGFIEPKTPADCAVAWTMWCETVTTGGAA